MYVGVPSAKPAEVSVPDSVSALAIPKSATTACRLERRMFSGLMSRCTTPCSCANSSASSTSSSTRTAACTGSTPSRAIRARSVSPVTYGII